MTEAEGLLPHTPPPPPHKHPAWAGAQRQGGLKLPDTPVGSPARLVGSREAGLAVSEQGRSGAGHEGPNVWRGCCLSRRLRVGRNSGPEKCVQQRQPPGRGDRGHSRG